MTYINYLPIELHAYINYSYKIIQKIYILYQ